MLATMRRHATTLTLFAALTTGLTALVHALTKPTIDQQALQQQQALFDQVIPGNRYDNALQQECYLVSDPALGNSAAHRLYLARLKGQPVAAVLETTAPDGYSGAIQLLLAADFHGNVLGSRVLEHHETPGLGDKIEVRISDWITRFSGRQINGAHDAHWAVKKDGGDFDQFTGATITPRAVVNAIKRSTLWLANVPAQLATFPRCGGEYE